MRIPAGDLERAVNDRLVSFLGDRTAVFEAIRERVTDAAEAAGAGAPAAGSTVCRWRHDQRSGRTGATQLLLCHPRAALGLSGAGHRRHHSCGAAANRTNRPAAGDEQPATAVMSGTATVARIRLAAPNNRTATQFLVRYPSHRQWPSADGRSGMSMRRPLFRPLLIQFLIECGPRNRNVGSSHAWKTGVYLRFKFRQKISYINGLDDGGEGGIRTHGTRKRTTVFETVPIDRSGTSPVSAASPYRNCAETPQCLFANHPASCLPRHACRPSTHTRSGLHGGAQIATRAALQLAFAALAQW